MPPKVRPIYSGSVGVDTVHHPDDIAYDKDTGVTALAKAVNAKVEKSARGRPRVSRAYGYSLHTAGAFHSGWRDTGDAFAGIGTALYRVRPDKTLQGVRSNLTGDHISFAQWGDETLYSNGTQNGIILDGTSRAWALQTYVGPDTDEQFVTAPVCNYLDVRNGRVMLNPSAEPNVICWSEQAQYGLFSLAVNHKVFEDAVIMIAGVEAGYFISTTTTLYFLREVSPNEWKREWLDSHPAIERSLWHQKVKASELGLDVKGDCRLWRGATGAIVGLPDGNIVNMTEKQVKSAGCGGYGASIFVPPYYIHSAGV